jgi:hypothetical protein
MFVLGFIIGAACAAAWFYRAKITDYFSGL